MSGTKILGLSTGSYSTTISICACVFAFLQLWPRMSEHHFQFKGTSIFMLIQSWASAVTMLVKMPHINMVLWYMFVLKKSSCNSNQHVWWQSLFMCESKRVYVFSGRFKQNNGDRHIIWIFFLLHLKILHCETINFSALPPCVLSLSSHKILWPLRWPNSFLSVGVQVNSTVLYFYICKFMKNAVFFL